MAKNSSVSIGEYMLQINEKNSVTVYRIYKSTIAALKECAASVNFEVKDTWFAQALGRNLLKEFCNGESSGTIGEFYIERSENGHIDAYREYKNSKGAMREISDAIGFPYEKKWNTQTFGSKLMAYAQEHGPFKIKKAKKEDSAKETASADNNQNAIDNSVFDVVDVDDLGFLLEFEVKSWDGEIDADVFAAEVRGEVAVMAKYGFEDGDTETVVRADSNASAFDDVVFKMDERLTRNFLFDTPEEGYRKFFYVKNVNMFDNDGRMTFDEYTQDEEWIAKHMFAAKALEEFTQGCEVGKSRLSWPYDGASCIAKITWDGQVDYIKLSDDGSFEDTVDIDEAQWNALKARVISGDDVPGPNDLYIKDKWLRRQMNGRLYEKDSFEHLPKSCIEEWQQQEYSNLQVCSYYVHSLEGLEEIPGIKEIELQERFLETSIDVSKFKDLKTFIEMTPYLKTAYVSKEQDIDFSEANVTVEVID